MKTTRDLLVWLSEQFPSPRPDQRHSLTLDGDVLVLTLMMGHTYQRFNFDPVDLDKPLTQLKDELTSLIMSAPIDPDTAFKPVA